ncbi:glycosyltransferase family 1 protein [Georgenia satyanarayanai]|uniref:glycosyltransferase family 1 protein n=1 Tax=Georgenia satyanarayanai TaxID=860221 RepID=UPI002041A29E|nr:glycosyltransferase family 1 protein [Georgenia satyanarayanai]MCM3661070.1 glycosyltransferase family 1 protein [Georgenia satyanarayanai]
MPSRPSVLVLSFSPIHADARVLRQVRLLSETYDVTTCGYGPAPDGVVDHVEIPAEHVYWRKDQRLLLKRRYAAVHRSNAVVRYLWNRLPRGHFDVVLADDIDTVPLALSLQARAGVHVDLHEYAPRQNEEMWRWRLLVAPYFRWLCRTFLPHASSVTTVGAGLAAEYEREFGIRASVVVNAPHFADLTPGEVGESIRLVHAGNARRGRRLELMFDAVAASRRPLTLDLYLMPNDPVYLAELRERAESMPEVTVHDPVPPTELARTLSAYDIGVYVLPPVSFNNLWALPNKFFDFIQGRLGLVVGPSPEMAGIVRQHGLGAVTEDFTAAALTAVLDELDPAEVRRWKQASHEVAEEYSAEQQTRGWADAVAAIVG